MRMPTTPGWKWKWCPKDLLRERTVWGIVLSYKTYLRAHYHRHESQPWKSNDSVSQRLCDPGQSEAMHGGDELYEKPRTFFMSLTAFWSLLRQFIALGSHSGKKWLTSGQTPSITQLRRTAYVKAEEGSLVIPVIPPSKEMLWITIPCSLVNCWARPFWNLCGREWEILPIWDIYPAGWQGLW